MDAGQVVPFRQDNPSAKALAHDVIPIFDQSRFALMKEIATGMAHCGVLPAHLRSDDFKTTVGTCLMLVNQSMNWGMDPYALAQETYSVHGKFGYSGKVVASALERKLGLKLRFEFAGGGMQRMVRATDPSDSSRYVEGTVADWHTKDKSGNINRAWLAQPDDMLIYRANRQFARRYEPSVMMGIYTDDELTTAEMNRRADSARDVTPRAVSEKPLPPQKAEDAATNVGASNTPQPPAAGEATKPETGPEPEKAPEAKVEVKPDAAQEPPKDDPAEYEDLVLAAISACADEAKLKELLGRHKDKIEKLLSEKQRQIVRVAAKTRMAKFRKESAAETEKVPA